MGRPRIEFTAAVVAGAAERGRVACSGASNEFLSLIFQLRRRDADQAGRALKVGRPAQPCVAASGGGRKPRACRHAATVHPVPPPSGGAAPSRLTDLSVSDRRPTVICEPKRAIKVQSTQSNIFMQPDAVTVLQGRWAQAADRTPERKWLQISS